MGLKNKAFGLMTALALTFTSVSGAMAAPVPGDVDLTPGDCVLVLHEADFHFGNWKWNGPAGAYQLAVPGSNESSVLFDVYYPTPQGGLCYFTATTDGLYRNGDTSTTPLTDFSHNPISAWPYIAIGATEIVNGGGPQGWDYWKIRLNSVPNTYATGNYSGTFEFQVSSVSP